MLYHIMHLHFSILIIIVKITFNSFVFAFSAALFLPQIFGCSNEVWLYAAVGAAFTVIFQLLYTKALSMGNVSLTVLSESICDGNPLRLSTQVIETA